MVRRELQSHLLETSGQFKAVLLTGPRQSGKTALVRMVFPGRAYVSLEDPDERMLAEADPRRFLSRFPDGAILDEAQRVPVLFSYPQNILDEADRPASFIITGSQHLGLVERVSQSLAGRGAVLTLLPFSHSELGAGAYAPASLEETLFSGAYPPVFDRSLDPETWYNSYITTYVERDVRQLLNVRDLSLFQRFLSLCAGSVGQMLNTSRVGADRGVNHTTVRQWLSVLEASYVAARLQPHHRNFRKRLVKTPKLYFWDVGLAARLLGIDTPAQLLTHSMRGALFENWVVVEWHKGRFHRGKRPNLHFWRNNTGQEVDIIAESADGLRPIEVKSGATVASDWLGALDKWMALAGAEAHKPTIVFGGPESRQVRETHILSWQDIADLAASV